MRSLIETLKYLTVWGRCARKAPAPEALGAVAIYFPLVGLVLGLLLALLNYAFNLYLDSQLLSILLIGFLILANGAVHCDGTKKTFDALFSNTSPLVPPPTSFGLIALFLLTLLKIRAVELIDEKIAPSLLLAPALARWSLVIFLFGYQDRCEASARRIAEQIRIWHLLATTIALMGLAFYLLGRKGLWIGLTLSLLALLARSFLHRRYSVLTQDHLGAMIELSEMMSLILLASL